MATKEVKVYRVVMKRECKTIDMDMCPIFEEETFFDDFFADKEDAMATAKNMFDKQPLDAYVSGVWVSVFVVAIGNGSKQQRIFSNFKKR